MRDMEFLQFHPTGMVWPPSVRGILVTEGVRGEGGILQNSEGRRFMFDDIPDAYSHQTSDNEEEGWRYITGDKEARRPPELLTRDHVARCIIREIKEGRGSPHGGVFLNIHWIKEHIKDAEEHIKKKLPSMYHQFKELAGVDITKESMEVGPTTHYVMGGIKVDADTQMSTVPGLFAAGECAGGLHGANRLGGNSLSDLVVFGKRAGQYAAEYAAAHDMPDIDEGQVQDISNETLAPFERGDSGENPFQIQQALQDMMQAKAGIVRTHAEMGEGLEELEKIKARAAKCGVQSNRDFNPGWNTATRSQTAARLQRDDPDERHRPQGIKRRPLSRRSSREVSRTCQVEHHHPQGRGRRDDQDRGRDSGHPKRPPGRSSRRTSDEQGDLPNQPWRRWRPVTGGLRDRDRRGHGRPRRSPPDPIRGRLRSRGALELQGRQVRLVLGRNQRHAPPDVHDQARGSRPLRSRSPSNPCGPSPMSGTWSPTSRYNYRAKKSVKPFKPRKPDNADGTWNMKQEDVERVQEFRKCIECFLCQDVCHVLRDHHKHEEFIGPRHFVYSAALEMHPLDTEDRVGDLKKEQGIGYCNITKCCTVVCPEHIKITDNAIIPLKERVVDEFYDPITKLFRMFKPRK